MLESKEDLSISRGNIQSSIFASSSRQRPVSRCHHEGYFILFTGRSQDDSRPRRYSPFLRPGRVPLPSVCRFRPCRAGMRSPYSPMHAGMIVSCNYQKISCPRPQTLCRTTLFAIYYSTKLANKHHPLEARSVDISGRQPV